jgi:hypothetical protein
LEVAHFLTTIIGSAYHDRRHWRKYSQNYGAIILLVPEAIRACLSSQHTPILARTGNIIEAAFTAPATISGMIFYLETVIE